MKLTVGLKLGLVIIVTMLVMTTGLAVYLFQSNRAQLMELNRQQLYALGQTAALLFTEQDIALINEARNTLMEQLTPVNQTLLDLRGNDARAGLSGDALSSIQTSASSLHLGDRLMQLRQQPDLSVQTARLAVAISGVPLTNLFAYLADSEAQPYDPAAQHAAYAMSGFVAAGSDSHARALRDGQVSLVEHDDTDQLTLLVPLKASGDRVVAALALGIPASVLATHSQIATDTSVMIVAVCLLAALLAAALVAYLIQQPMYLLRVGVGRMRAGDFARPIPLRRQDDLGALADGLNALGEQLNQQTRLNAEQYAKQDAALTHAQQEIDRLSRLLKEENQDLGSERALLMQMRQASFPEAGRLARLKGWDIALHCQLTSRLAGAIFDVLEGPDQQVWFCMGNVSGYGLETSLMALQVNASLSGLLKLINAQQDPAQILARLNAELCDANERYQLNRHVNLLLIGQQGKRNIALSGQYENPWMFRAGGAEQTLDANALGVPLGVSLDAGSAFQSLSVNLEGSDVLVLLSSGWLALLDKKDANLERQLKKLIKLNVSQDSETLSQMILKALEPVLREVKKDGVTYPDDLALVVIKRKSA